MFSTHSSISDITARLFKIFQRYGLSSKKMKSNLQLYVDTVSEHEVVPTFPITASLIKRYHKCINEFADNGVEFCIHGYDHFDYTKLSSDQRSNQLNKAVMQFQKKNLKVTGFRFPYLCYNHECLADLSKKNIKWDSSSCVSWPLSNKVKYKSNNYIKYQEMINRYNYRKADSCVSVPKFFRNLLQIPVFLPDDDLLERLGIMDNETVSNIWNQILNWTHSKGEIFTLQLHPERITLYKKALESLIERAKSLEPKVWLASLGSIYEWWNEKKQFYLKIISHGDSKYEIEAHCSPRAAVLVKLPVSKDVYEHNGWNLITGKKILLESSKVPIIGVHPDSAPSLVRFLKNEGFAFEVDGNNDQYSVYLGEFTNYSEKDDITVLEKIQTCALPVVRFWRWPHGYQSALSVTGDIDAMSVVDFFERTYRKISNKKASL
jgi:peptidoglycan/xylan/chitin deacetylase (PgdA/CDA1 family)